MKLITSVSQFMEFVEKNCASGLHLFRGQRRDDPLLPKIARMQLTSDFKSEEQKLMQEFKIRSSPYLDVATPDYWDWLAIAQHNRMATRLLDWTDNPLAALWFAVEKPPDKEQHGVLWLFRVLEEDMVLSQEKENPFNCKRTKVFRPKHITKSISAQGGWFTVHRYLESEKRFVPLEKNKLYRKSLEKLCIDRAKFPELRQQLDRCGVNQSTMFPDLTGLCEYLNWRYRGRLGVSVPEGVTISQIS
jgi:hypothetical protein